MLSLCEETAITYTRVFFPVPPINNTYKNDAVCGLENAQEIFTNSFDILIILFTVQQKVRLLIFE